MAPSPVGLQSAPDPQRSGGRWLLLGKFDDPRVRSAEDSFRRGQRKTLPGKRESVIHKAKGAL